MNLIKHTKLYFILSLIILIPGVVALLAFGLNLSIDFTGGSLLEYKITNQPTLAEITDIFAEHDVKTEEIIFDKDSKVNIKTKPIDAKKSDELTQALSEKFTNVQQLSFETVGPSVGRETTKNSITAVIVASVGILLYIAYAFRNIPKPYSSFHFGVCAIIAMLHDAFVVLGIFAILGHFLNVETDALFITAILTVIGFSVHDTIVVFDRIRENLKKLPQSWKFPEIVNYSLVETLNRSLATSLTVIMTLTALFLLGGQSIKHFALALLIGIISGTYSSIFNAAPLLVVWENRIAKKDK